MNSILFAISAILLCARGEKVPITPCHQSDKACMMSTAKQVMPYLTSGIPEFGISTLDPMSIGTVTENNTGLFIELRNTLVKGLKNCNLLDVRRHNLKLSLNMMCSLTLTGDYTLGGRLLIMPVEGEGDYRIRIHDIEVKVYMDLGEKLINNENHWYIHNWKHTTDVKGNVNFLFNNLFHGNGKFSKAIHDFANSSWQIIYSDIAPPIVKAIVAKILNQVIKIFNHVPIKDLTLD